MLCSDVQDDGSVHDYKLVRSERTTEIEDPSKLPVKARKLGWLKCQLKEG